MTPLDGDLSDVETPEPGEMLGHDEAMKGSKALKVGAPPIEGLGRPVS